MTRRIQTTAWKRVLVLVCALAVIPMSGTEADANLSARHRKHQTVEYHNLEDIQAEIAFGRQVATAILTRYKLYKNLDMTRYINLVGKALAMHGSRPELEYHFAILDTQECNAFAAPGGYVFVTLGALRNMQDESELAAVLAHEIGHINSRHIVKELNIRGDDEQGGMILCALIGGLTDPMRVAYSQLLNMATEILFEKGYKQKDENEADRTAVILTALTGYDPTGLERFLARLSKESDANQIGTHLPNQQRVKALESYLRDNNLDPKPNHTLKERFRKHVQM